ncbi:hypothetical protein HII31_05307 [Pseudocercospora fuligena]|uniref:Uncharacterized protein n=1 Tax=Pseudocercospora fuligena TaxID=685502 RepID=A0A8H6RM24_9PEZI|nr:hypothetical protein HII31_05307 [Pseudocercospora fuligena]
MCKLTRSCWHGRLDEALQKYNSMLSRMIKGSFDINLDDEDGFQDSNNRLSSFKTIRASNRSFSSPFLTIMQFTKITFLGFVAIVAAIPAQVTDQNSHKTIINNDATANLKAAATPIPKANALQDSKTGPTCDKTKDTCLTQNILDGKPCTISCPDDKGVFKDTAGTCVTLPNGGPRECCVGVCS